MIKYLDNPVTYNDLKDLTLYTDNHFIDFKMICLLISIILSFIILYIASKISYSGIIFTVSSILIVGLCIIAGGFGPYYFKKSMIINEELNDYKPQFRNVHITSYIDDISNGSGKSSQELRFEHNGKNYYALIPSDIPVTTNDKITINIKKQIIDKNLNKKHLSESINHPKNKITIYHRNKTYNTKLIINDDAKRVSYFDQLSK